MSENIYTVKVEIIAQIILQMSLNQSLQARKTPEESMCIHSAFVKGLGSAFQKLDPQAVADDDGGNVEDTVFTEDELNDASTIHTLMRTFYMHKSKISTKCNLSSF